MRHLLPLLLLAGCAAPFHPAAQCRLKGTGMWYLQVDTLGCDYYQDILDAAVADVEAKGFAPAEKFRAAIAGVTGVWVHQEERVFDYTAPSLGPSIPATAAGDQYDLDPWADDIQVNHHAGPILHELLHVWDIHGLGASAQDSAAHKHWDERGWWAEGQAFMTAHGTPLY